MIRSKQFPTAVVRKEKLTLHGLLRIVPIHDMSILLTSLSNHLQWWPHVNSSKGQNLSGQPALSRALDFCTASQICGFQHDVVRRFHTWNWNTVYKDYTVVFDDNNWWWWSWIMVVGSWCRRKQNWITKIRHIASSFPLLFSLNENYDLWSSDVVFIVNYIRLLRL